ncbi:hypothetical protein K5D56_04490 [Pseudomonas cichorii]|nr:hypothetical protein [Pseudomonas cichorii]
MLHNPQRLPAVIEIGLLATQAKLHSLIDMHHSDAISEASGDVWDTLYSKVIELAIMDHRHNFTPKSSPTLADNGLLKIYQEARDSYNPEHDDYQYQPSTAAFLEATSFC